MDQVLFVIIVLVILYIFKDKWLKYMPNIVKKNVLVSVLVFGFLLYYFMKNNVEGFDLSNDSDRDQFMEKCCEGRIYRSEGVRDTREPLCAADQIVGGSAVATAMCQRLDQLRAEDEGGTVGMQRERIDRLNMIKENLSPECCAGDSWNIVSLFTCLNDLTKGPNPPYGGGEEGAAAAWQALTGKAPDDITPEGTENMRNQLCN